MGWIVDGLMWNGAEKRKRVVAKDLLALNNFSALLDKAAANELKNNCRHQEPRTRRTKAY